MKKILVSISTVAIVAIVAVTATRAYFSSTVTSEGNTFTAGTLNLQVNGGSGFIPYSVFDLAPGETRGTPTYAIKNTGSLPGVLSYKVKNVVVDENGVLAPEAAAGDEENKRLDPDGFTIAASGYGELLDQVMLTFWVDDTPGQRPAPFDWQDTKFWDSYPDESSHYSLPVNTNLLAGKTWKSGPNAGKEMILQPGETAYMGIGVKFISDTDTSYGWILDGVPNNAAMGDDFKFGIEVGLEQVHP